MVAAPLRQTFIVECVLQCKFLTFLLQIGRILILGRLSAILAIEIFGLSKCFSRKQKLCTKKQIDKKLEISR